jgi:hypothetical protein
MLYMCIYVMYRSSAVQRETLTKRRERLWAVAVGRERGRGGDVKPDFTTFIFHFLENKIIENVKRRR